MSKIMTAFVAGIAIGILVAPRKGSETRKKIIDGACDIQEDLKDLVNDTSENLKSGLAAAESQARDLLEKGKERLGGFREGFN